MTWPARRVAATRRRTPGAHLGDLPIDSPTGLSESYCPIEAGITISGNSSTSTGLGIPCGGPSSVLPVLRAPAVEPLAATPHPPTRQVLLTFVGAYDALNRTLRANHEQPFDSFGPDTNEVPGHLPLPETVVLRTNHRTNATAAPTHPRYPGTTRGTARSWTPSTSRWTTATGTWSRMRTSAHRHPRRRPSPRRRRCVQRRSGTWAALAPALLRQTPTAARQTMTDQHPRAGRGATGPGTALPARLPAQPGGPARYRRVPGARRQAGLPLPRLEVAGA
jgi:hypothetical protein